MTPRPVLLLAVCLLVVAACGDRPRSGAEVTVQLDGGTTDGTVTPPLLVAYRIGDTIAGPAPAPSGLRKHTERDVPDGAEVTASIRTAAPGSAGTTVRCRIWVGRALVELREATGPGASAEGRHTVGR
ncbi:hypothetical protein [Tsukamurella sp. PLM1]|uniref:hypothetical protein n=1 Tax=Tsukamurella sp. PLM1 TaxID=2929795 RepID=UPI00205C9165|nr:hypothetical protein [Tsukamurella sp. PLM1]BDH57287.1 hypothetical protein MTP03_22260 [Tsukamurella sp. PLM1]